MSIRYKLKLLLLILFISAIGNTIFIFILEDQEEDKLDWVIHTHMVLTQSEKLHSSMIDAETGQRGYLLTKDTTYLEPYYLGLTSSQQNLKTLMQLTSDNPGQQERLDAIKNMMVKKFDELSKTISLMKTSSDQARNEALQIVKEDIGKKYMDAIRDELLEFNSIEQVLLEERKGDFRESRAYITTIVGAEIIFFITMALVTWIFIRDKLFSPLEKLLETTSKVERGEKQQISDVLPDDEMGYLLSRFYQMSEKIHSRTEELSYAASHDHLTGLRNRSNLKRVIDESLVNITSDGQKVAVLFLDLNKFKQLNDTLGHDAGDAVLIETANRLKDSVRLDDDVFRLGGDEFVIVAKYLSELSEVKKLVSKIANKFSSTYIFQGESLDISISIGVAIAPENTMYSVELLKFADIAMYMAKADKETSFKFYEKSMLTPAIDSHH
ncbi:MAG: diguanylate cyclase [Gammaproteobacteria bacterium]|nr:diguanylate cyclase [Gammaproteobacteria bacterium]